MMKNKIIAILVVLCFILAFGGYFYNQYWNNKVKKSPVMFPYQTYWGPANPVFIITDLKYKKALISYYDTIANNPSSNPVIYLPIKTLPPFEPVYVVGYSEDSLLVDVVSYFNRGPRFGGDYLRGWVYAKILHKFPPKK